mmetsp:Transcript_42607/g.132555  ORF Transcript_42607/g.132555 Transcript_42607/m.132555 type:complete len:318 (+) Transcript_42607:458-1411(+)
MPAPLARLLAGMPAAALPAAAQPPRPTVALKAAAPPLPRPEGLPRHVSRGQPRPAPGPGPGRKRCSRRRQSWPPCPRPRPPRLRGLGRPTTSGRPAYGCPLQRSQQVRARRFPVHGRRRPSRWRPPPRPPNRIRPREMRPCRRRRRWSKRHCARMPMGPRRWPPRGRCQGGASRDPPPLRRRKPPPSPGARRRRRAPSRTPARAPRPRSGRGLRAAAPGAPRPLPAAAAPPASGAAPAPAARRSPRRSPRRRASAGAPAPPPPPLLSAAGARRWSAPCKSCGCWFRSSWIHTAAMGRRTPSRGSSSSAACPARTCGV